MDKQKKTALDIACEELVRNDCCCSQCEHLDLKCHCFAVKNTGRNDVPNICFEQFKQYFQKQATIPDGWGVVKEIYSFVKHDVVDWTTKIEMFIKDKLEEAGIKVE